MGTDTHLFFFSPLPFFLSHPFFSPPPFTVLFLPYLSLLSRSCPLLCPLFFPSPPIHSSPLWILPYFSFPYLYFPSSLLPSYSYTHSSPISLPSQSSPTLRIVFSLVPSYPTLSSPIPIYSLPIPSPSFTPLVLLQRVLSRIETPFARSQTSLCMEISRPFLPVALHPDTGHTTCLV